MFARRAVKILHSFTALLSESWQAISRRQEPRIRTDVADQRGLSAAIRRIRENPWFLALRSCASRFDVADLAAHARRALNAPYIAKGSPARRLLCFVACFGLILSGLPAVPAGPGESAEKPGARLTQGPPGLNLPDLNEARRMSHGVPKIAPPVSVPFASTIAPAPPPTQEETWPMAMLAPTNRVGAEGEDLLSRNYNWTLPLVSLPGRAGLNLNFALSLNSLIWTKSGGDIHFNKADGFPSPGFHLGFPELKTYFYNSEAVVGSRLVIMPSGKSFEFWENTALGNGIDYIYEERNGSNMIIVETPGLFGDPNETVWSLLTPDGTAYKYVVVGSNPKCVEIKDRNGNYISVTYNTSTEKITRIIDTLDREVDFNYDSNNRLTSITQDWGGTAHTWATFAYSTVTISAGFLSLNMVGAQNGQTIPVLSRVGLADGSVHSFEYNTYGQAHTIRRYAPNTATPGSFPDDYTQLSYVTYDLPRDGTGQLNDCPRFTTRKDLAHNWNNNNEVTTRFAGDLSSWGSVTTPDDVIYKEFYGAGGAWQRGLTTETETRFGGVRKKRTTLEWTQDNTGLAYPLNPRLKETNVYDDANNRRRVRMSYTSFGLVSDVYEYAADATTVLRRTQTDYNLSDVYTSRRIIGLPSAVYLYDGDDTLFSKVTFEYDLNPDPNPYLQHPGPTARHDTANYGLDFVEGRGNLNRKLRWDVTDPDTESKASKYETGYNTSGSVIFTRDPENHETTVSYDDSFSDEQNDRNTYAYPTTMTDADTFPSYIQYNYNFGAVTRMENPKEAAVVNTYDPIGRLDRVTNQVNQAYTRYVYAPNHHYVQSFTTVNDLSSEFYQITVFDGHGRTRGVASDHPGSVGGYKAQRYEYNIMGRLVLQTNPTEITVTGDTWEPAGDDAAAGWVWSGQVYDWKGRTTVSYFQGYNPDLPDSENEPYKDKEIIYGGCGCAGGETMTIIDVGQITGTGQQRRKRKVVHDALGRVKTEQIFEWESAVNPYSTKTYTYDAIDRVTNIEERAEASGVTQNTVTIYDGHGRLWKRRLPQFQAGAFQIYEYNDDDTLRSTTDARGAVGNFEYYARKQISVADYSVPPGDPNMTDTPTVNFKYDSTGNMTEMDDGPGKVKYVYDILGRLTEERRFFDSLDNPDQGVAPDLEEGGRRPFILKYEYNLSGKIKKVTDPRNDFIEYSYNSAGLLTSVSGSNFAGVTNYVTGIQYRAWGAPKQATYGSGHTATSKYSPRMQIRQYDLPGVMGATYAYNPDKQLKTMMAATDANPTGYDRRMDRSFLYDHVGRTIRTRASEEAGLGGGPNFLFRQDYGYDAFGNMTSRGGAYWPNGNGEVNGQFNWAYTNNRATVTGQTWTYDGMGYLKKVTRPDPINPGQTVTEQNNVIDAVGRIVTSTGMDGAGQVVEDSSGRHLRSRVFGGQIVTTIPVGEKSRTRVYVGGDYLAEQVMFGQLPEKVSWHFRDPLNTMSRDVGSDASSNILQAIDPLGGNVMTTDGVNLIHYYDCLRVPGGFPYCGGTPPPSFYTPPSPYGAASNFSVKVDGALTILSVGDIMGILQRQGIQASVWISPALNGTPLTQGLAGSFVKRTTSGWVEKPGHITAKGKYESDWEEALFDTWDFVPGGEPEPQGRRQQGDGRRRESENLETAEGFKGGSCVVTLVARKINFDDVTVLGWFDSSLKYYHMFVTTGPSKGEWDSLYHGAAPTQDEPHLRTQSRPWATAGPDDNNWDRAAYEKYGGVAVDESVPRSCDTIKSNFDDTLKGIHQAKFKYNMIKGPNSNSTIYTMLIEYDQGLFNRLNHKLWENMPYGAKVTLFPIVGVGTPIPGWGVRLKY